MKLELLSRTKLVVVFLSLLICATMGELTAQTNSIKDITNNKYALKNVLENIKSDNDGVKRSSIYLVGYYRITEAEEALIEQLKKEENPRIRILIALALYELGNEDGLLAFKNLATADNNKKIEEWALKYIMNT